LVEPKNGKRSPEAKERKRRSFMHPVLCRGEVRAVEIAPAQKTRKKNVLEGEGPRKRG